jgi:serine/threonine protein kinase
MNSSTSHGFLSSTDVHSRLNHPNVVSLLGAGLTSKGVRFVVLERLDGGTLTQMLGYDTRIRDRRRRFWKKKPFSYVEVLNCARSIADAMAYCQEEAIPGCMVLHRDLKPDNIGFTLNGIVKLLDFGLAKIVENASAQSDDTYDMSGETGSLRYMAPEGKNLCIVS